MDTIHPGFSAIWLGHGGFLIQTPGGKTIAIDPWIGNPVYPAQYGSFDKLDLILVTHGHGDHTASAAELSKKHGAAVVAIHELANYLAAKGATTLGMNKGGTARIEGIEVTMVQALHSSAEVQGDKITYLGDPAGYVVRCEDGFTFYFSGDTAVFLDMQLIAEIYKPELAFLSIGDLYTMGPREAAVAIRLLKVKKVIPMHWGTFGALTGTPDELRKLTADVDGLTIYDLKPGDSV